MPAGTALEAFTPCRYVELIRVTTLLRFDTGASHTESSLLFKYIPGKWAFQALSRRTTNFPV